MIMILFKSSIDIIAISKKIGQGLESEQCVELGPGKVSTLSFRTELHKLPPDFWSKVSQWGQTQSSRNDGMFPQGVDNSKMILEAILGKIKLYEKGQDKKWAELIQVGVVFKVFSGTQNTV